LSDPFTLRIFVPSGDPEGVRIVDRMNWTGKGYFLPRDRWSDIKARPELARPGVYVLIGQETDALGAERPVVYIGQSEDVQSRINQHDLGKEFRDKAAIFISTSGGLNRAHTTWLEWELIQRAAPGLKWIAAYQSAPVSAITHIAEIERLEPYGDAGKFKVVFKGPATKLKKPIPLAGAPSGSMQGPRYTTHAALLEAHSVKELMS